MRFETFVALRYLLASRRRAHIALISVISVAGLAIGVMALIVSLALLSGFQDRIRRQMMERTAHLRVSPERGATLPDAAAARRALSRAPGVVSVSDAIEGRAWASDADGTTTVPVRFRNSEEAAPPGALDGARISASTGARLHVAAGDLIRLSSSRTRLSPIGPVPISVVLPVLQARRTGLLERSADVEVSENTARTLSGIGQGVFALEARLRDPREADAAARAVRASLPAGSSYRVETWRDRNAPLAFALRLEKLVIFVTVALVVVVAALNVVSNIALTVVEKKRDLGVFTSMGAAPLSLQRVYLTLGAVIGVIGTSAGLALGIGLSIAADRFELVPLPSDVYLLSHVPFAVHPAEVAAVAVFAFGTALLAAVMPARAAARLAPGEAIRLSR
jgi:lipoprotein-releasing system permease protein